MPNIDPNAPLIDTRLPIALLPLRLETRFVQSPAGSELLVRIFPDEVQIDRHGPPPARARLLPGAFVAIGYADQAPSTPATPGGALFAVRGNPVLEDPPVAPDPAAASQHPWDAGSRWLADFPDAERRGLAIRVPIDAATAQAGLKRLVVVGVRDGDAAAAVAALLTGHRQAGGLGVVPLGTPTNNTADAPSGWASETPLPDEPIAIGSDALAAEQALGLPRGTIASAPNGGLRQLAGPRWMNTLLWRATWGYFLEQMMAAVDTHAPLLTAASLVWARAHFIDFVRADGPLPAIRIGRQPYGVLPVTTLAGWPAGDRTGQLARLLASLRDRLFRPAADGLVVLTPGRPGLDRAIADLLAQQAHAWRYMGRSQLGAQYARTLFAFMRWGTVPPTTSATLPHFPAQSDPPAPEDNPDVSDWTFINGSASASPARLPVTGDAALYTRLFTDGETKATQLLRDVLADLGTAWRPRLGRGVFIDARFPINPIVADGSYLNALRADAKTFASMRGEAPAALLDRLARHALLLEGAAAAGRRGFVDSDFVNVTSPADGSPVIPDVWSVLGARTVAALAGSAGDLKEVRDAIAALSALPPADLERLLTGTLDLCSHRLDAWITSLAHRRLIERRQATPSGVYVGSYGWVADLRPRPPNPAVPDEHLLAPSLEHAVTAAILRAGYQTHRDAGGTMAIDLSSARVRAALWLLDGVRQGQPLAGLLGYRFERGLQERSQPGHLLGPYIAPFRRLAPLASGLLPPDSRAAAAAHDVTDGLALAQIHQRNRDAGTPPPFGSTATFEARVRVDRIDGDSAVIIAKADQSAESEYLFAVRSDGRLTLAWHTEGGMTWGTPSHHSAASTRPIPRGQWTHLAAVRDRTTVTFYIDGSEAGSSAPVDERRFRESATRLPVRIGAERPAVRPLAGRVREVRLWNIAHTANEVRALAAGPLGGQSAGLAACWSFAEGAGGSIGDRSPYRRTGTVHGAGNPPWVHVTAVEDPLWGEGPALELNGTQYVEIPHARNLSLGAVDGLPVEGVDLTLVTEELDALCDTVDAVSDLTLAESVHHVTLGNPSRAGAVLDALSRGELPPPEIEIARTPRGGVLHSHRLAALFVEMGAPPRPWTADATRLRAVAEPRLNEWAGALLGTPGRAVYRGEYLDADGVVVSATDFSLSETALALTPLDIVYAAPGQGEPGLGELEQRLLYQRLLRPPAGVAWSTVRLNLERQREWRSEWITLPEFLEAAATLRRMLDQARPFAGRDLTTTGSLDLVDADDLRQRVALVTDGLIARKAALAAAGSAPLKQRVALLAAAFDVPGAVPRSLGVTEAEKAALGSQVRAVADEIDRRLAHAAAATDDMNRLSALFGGSIRIVPRLRLTAELRDGLRAAFKVGSTEPAWSSAALRPAAWDWLARLSRVRDGARHLDDLMLYDSALNGRSPGLHVAQWPPRDGEAWVGLPGASASLPGGRVSMAALTPDGSLDLDRLVGGLIIDEWTETVPRAAHNLGLAFRADAPGAAPPQAILLAVPNDARPHWTVAGLEAILLETLDLARMRMLGPQDLGPANHFLPATLLAFNPAGDTVSTDLVSGA